MKGRSVILKMTTVSILFLFVLVSVGQANITIENEVNKIIKMNMGGSRGLWEDNFNDASKIDTDPPGQGMSDNYEVSGGKVKMINTYEAWTDPDFTKLIVIDVTNSAGQTLNDYALEMEIPYDSDMQSDYDDLRFKHEYETDEWLSYWIESYDSTSANVWVSIQTLQIGTTELYMFYGNENADSESDFGGVCTDWDEEWNSDEQVTNHADNEGTWDPDVCFDGDDEFIVGWEEGQAYYPPYTWGFKQEIRASIYDSSGSKLVNDKLVYKDSNTFFRNENPSICFGNSKWFVAWQRWKPAANPSDSTLNIRARTVQRSGSSLSLGSVIEVCNEDNTQADPNVAYDSINNRFFVCWEDARDGNGNYQIYGKLYNANTGQQVGSEKTIAKGSKNEVEPWVVFDSVNEQYFIVWEEGDTPNLGPFTIKGAIFNSDFSSKIWSGQISPTGTNDIDYNFPCVFFNSETEEYLVTWNDCDISDKDWWGNVHGKIINPSGGTVVDTFTISSGDYVRTDIKTYDMSDFDDPYFVTYDDDEKIWGKFVTAEGETSSSDVQLCVSTDPDMVADWANMDFGDGKIFVAWEDLRVDYPSQYDDYYPDVFANLWEHTTQFGLSVSYSIGSEIDQILLAHVTSIKIEKGDINYWDKFDAIGSNSGLEYSILDGDTGDVLIASIDPGDSLSKITADSIRLMATFTRDNPSSTPELDYWSASWITNNPPYEPSDPDPEDGATDVDVNADLSWSGGDPDGDDVTYDVYFGTSSPPPLKATDLTETTYDPGKMDFDETYYWKIIAEDEYGAETEGPEWSFTTYKNNPPYTPSDPDPEDGATNVDVNANLSWSGGDPDGDDVTYDVYFGTSSPPPLKATDLTETTYDPGTMNFDETYYWKIIAEDEHGEETEGPEWDFTTGSNDPPYEPSDPDPPDGAKDVDVDSDLSWTGGDPNPGDTVKYDIYFGTETPPPLIVENYPETTYEPGILQFDTKYYWKITAKDTHGAETEGPEWSFTTRRNNPPYMPSNPDPPNGATEIDIDYIISWDGGDPDPEDTVTYDLYLGITNPPDIYRQDLENTYYELYGMDYETIYYWKIVAKDNHGAETEGPVWHFITKEGTTNNPPYTPKIKCNQFFLWLKPNTLYDFEVSASDPEGEDVFYRVYWGDGEFTDWEGPYSSGQAVTFSHAWTEPLTPFVITASAKDASGYKCKRDAYLPIFVPRNVKNNILLRILTWLLENNPFLTFLKQLLLSLPIFSKILEEF